MRRCVYRLSRRNRNNRYAGARGQARIENNSQSKKKREMKTFKWSLVTGQDFARSIKWARKQPRLSDLALYVWRSRALAKKKSA